ncbi:hypothetical protein [Granulicella tundricola]|uniref:Uncharacterized protein n=1 Tax=Granulicella tundricola (strain ATCC BAA-1859 / DSM 23138 / MP5ACTX9) TaxID=1198114 RepID=E8WYZ6_GRATM|nr:hypothetical protein [Granulicella tundricola]ADW69911.1 hypothetical protein AciX9_2888 [Granulicella tundricola MP5ACTX9]
MSPPTYERELPTMHFLVVAAAFLLMVLFPCLLTMKPSVLDESLIEEI